MTLNTLYFICTKNHCLNFYFYFWQNTCLKKKPYIFKNSIMDFCLMNYFTDISWSGQSLMAEYILLF